MESLRRSDKVLFETNKELGKVAPAKSPFTAKMSHELRTPLNVIIGFSELMLDEVPGKINEEQRQCLNDILSNARRLLSLINNILDITRVDSGKEE
jgi:signal transduction histidine kinase